MLKITVLVIALFVSVYLTWLIKDLQAETQVDANPTIKVDKII